MARFRKRPIVIDAVQWTGENAVEVLEFMMYSSQREDFFFSNCDRLFNIKTKEGLMTASPGDWIIRGVEGELYPCKPSIFELSYESVESE